MLREGSEVVNDDEAMVEEEAGRMGRVMETGGL
jgi:hypothetical protein